MIPHHKQETNYTCGPACLRMAMARHGIKKTEKFLTKLLKTNKKRGTYHRAFLKAGQTLGMPWQSGTDSSITHLRKLLKQGYAVIIGYFPPEAGTDHYAIIKKITKDKVYLLDPYYGENHGYSTALFKKIWKSDHKYEKEDFWYFAI